jgi:hypothetical protein
MKLRWILPLVGLLATVWMLAIPAAARDSDQYRDLKKDIPFETLDELKVDVEIGVADILVEKTEGNNLLEAKIRYKVKRGEPIIKFDRSGKVGYLTIKSAENDEDGGHEYKGIHGLKSGEERWELRFSTRVPIIFTMDLGLVDGTLDMTGLKVVDMEVSSGLSDLSMYFDTPNPEKMRELKIDCGLGEFTGKGFGNANFQRLRVEGGLGSVKLDLSGQWQVPDAEVRVEIGLGSARLEVPEALGIEVNAADNFLSSIDLDRGFLKIRDGRHRTENWSEAVHRLVIDAEVGLGSLKINRGE